MPIAEIPLTGLATNRVIRAIARITAIIWGATLLSLRHHDLYSSQFTAQPPVQRRVFMAFAMILGYAISWKKGHDTKSLWPRYTIQG